MVRDSGGATPGRARSNDLARRSTALAPLCLLLCFASVIVWTENNNFTISDRWPLYLFYFDSKTISAVLAAFVFWGRRLKNKKGRQLFWGKKCIWVTWLEDVLSSKWPGSYFENVHQNQNQVSISQFFRVQTYCHDTHRQVFKNFCESAVPSFLLFFPTYPPSGGDSAAKSQIISMSEHHRARSPGTTFFSRRPQNTKAANAAEIVSLSK